MIGRFSSDSLLGAIAGIAYLVLPNGRIAACGGTDWAGFAQANGGRDLEPARVIGRDLFAIIQGEPVRQVYRRFHDVLLRGASKRVAFSFRCDCPELRRDLSLSITPVHRDGATTAFLYQSEIRDEQVRPRIPLFDFASGRFPADRAGDERPIVTLCSYCQRVAWPVGAEGAARSWIEADTYYRQGGPTDIRVSHGMCPDCHRRLMRELNENSNPVPAG